MRALQHTSKGIHGNSQNVFFAKSSMSSLSHLGEAIWLCITFLLFIAMGPFSVIAVLYGLWSLASAENKGRMVEPANC